VDNDPTIAFTNIFGNVVGNVLKLFVAISCLGTTNGLMLGCTRCMYSLANRGEGPAPKVFGQIDPHTNMPTNSAVLSLLFCGVWYFYFYASNLTTPVFGLFSFDSSELPIITIYAIYIPILVLFIKKEGKNNVFKNIVMPILAIIASTFMVFVAVYAHGVRPYQAAAENGEFSFPVLFYLIVFVVIMVIGACLYQKKNKK
jgi:APA family basic amino acid/polyamine antiporter